MMIFNPYFLMNGNAEEAIALYSKAFHGESQVMKYKDAPPDPGSPMEEGIGELVMHGEVRFKETAIMVCDATPRMPMTIGNNVQVAVSLESAEEVNRVYGILAEGGLTMMPPQETFFAQSYAMFADKFGVMWQLIAPNQKTVDTWAS